MRPSNQGTDMTSTTQSEYIRHRNKSALIRRWIATILLKGDLESHLTFSRLDRVITIGFDTSSFTKENVDDAPFIFDSGGDNDCGCADSREDCRVLTTNIEPPSFR